MNIKTIFVFVWELLTLPEKKWKQLTEWNEEEGKFLENIYYPLLGIVALCTFITPLFHPGTFDFQRSLKGVIVVCITYMGGLYLSAYLAEKIKNDLWGMEKSFSKSLLLVGSCYAPKLLIGAFFDFLPNLGLNPVFWGLIPYSVWNACSYYFEKDLKHSMFLFILLSIALISVPVLIQRVFLFCLMPNL